MNIIIHYAYTSVAYKVSLLLIDLVVAFVLFIFILVYCYVFLYCYRFSANKDLYESITAKRRLTGHVSADFRRRHPAHAQCRSLAKLPVLRKCNFPRN